MTSDNDSLIRKIKGVLDESVHGIDCNTLARLQLARQCALTQNKKQAIYYPWLRWGGIPVAIVVLVMLVNPWGIEQPEPATPLADLMLLTSVEGIDFFIEEIEFYQWLLETAEDEKEDHDLRRPDASDSRSSDIVCGTG